MVILLYINPLNYILGLIFHGCRTAGVRPPIYISTNHITAFLKTKNKESLNANYLKLLNQEMLSDQEIYILRSFTQFEARIYEQSIITTLKPVLNSTLVVTFPFLNWREGDTGGRSAIYHL